jgi:hypothetical protein
MQLVIKTDLPDDITVRQMVKIEPFKQAIAKCKKLAIEEPDILVALARGLEKKKERKAA